MTARIIDGKAAAAALKARVGEQAAEFTAETGITPGLAVVLVGADPASGVYVRNKLKTTEALGMRSFAHLLPDHVTQAGLMALVGQLNADPAVHGILVQLPLPGHLDAEAVLLTIDPDKDVDGFHPVNIGRLWSGAGDGFVPCTPRGCLHLLKHTLGDLAGAEALVIGRSNIVGKPMAALLLAENCTVTLAHSRTRDLPNLARRADILVAAAGKPRMVPGEWIKPGATIIDVGINRVPKHEGDPTAGTQLVGDVDFQAAAAIAAAITPVPGGVGPMTIACLMENTLEAARRMSRSSAG